MNKQIVYIHPMQYYSAKKRIKYWYVPGYTTRINLKIIILSKSQTQKTIHYIIPFI